MKLYLFCDKRDFDEYLFQIEEQFANGIENPTVSVASRKINESSVFFEPMDEVNVARTLSQLEVNKAWAMAK